MYIKDYPGLDYSLAEMGMEDPIPDMNGRYVHLMVPVGYPRMESLVRNGFSAIDRTIWTKVPLANSRMDFQKSIRMPVIWSDIYAEDIRTIAGKSFGKDYRFRTTLSESQSPVYGRLIDLWLEGQKGAFVCLYQGQPVGFADVRCLEAYGGAPFVYLAAVEERYRMAGAAMSLYASVFEYYRQQNVRYIYGRISSGNMAAMNLYAAFGAQFSNPCDVYIRMEDASRGGEH